MEHFIDKKAMHLIRYFFKLFTARIIALIVGIIITFFTFELIITKAATEMDFIQKIPLVLHKSLPIIVFIGTLLFLLRLMRFHELEALYSSGISMWGILKIPFIVTGLLVITDLFFIAPFSQRLIKTTLFKEKKGQITLNPDNWKVYATKNGYSIFYEGDPSFHWFSFSKNSDFNQHLFTEKTAKNNKHLELHDSWNIRSHTAPKIIKSVVIPLLSDLPPNNPYPFAMSLLEISKTNTSSQSINKQHTQAVSFQKNYFLSHALWIFSLIPFAAAVIIGPMKKSKRLLMIIPGIAICLGLYLAKEWLYAANIPVAFFVQPMFLWVVPLFTFFLSVMILFEKREL